MDGCDLRMKFCFCPFQKWVIFLFFLFSSNLYAQETMATHGTLEKILFEQKELNECSCIPQELKNLPYAIYPTDPEYNTERLNYNKLFVYFPKAIFNPTTHQEIQHVVRALKRHSLEFAVRSGGHCFEPGSLSSEFIVDLSQFNSIIPDTNHNEVYIGAGARLGDVIALLGQINYAIPTGTCPSVGVSGLALGGGIGLLCRQFGLTCDSVQSITLLNAEAEIIEVNEKNHHDLFWALRGAGNGSYGIVLGWTFKMYYIPEATFYELTWEWDPNLISPIMHAWQKWVKTLPSEISSVLAIRHPNDFCAEPHNTPPLVIRIFGLKVSPDPFDEWKKAFKHLHPHVKTFQGGYGDLSQYWAIEAKLPFVKSKSRILMEPVKEDTISQVTSFFEKLEHKDPDVLIYFEFEAFGGKVPKGETAFFPRDAFGWWYQAYYWQHQEESDEMLALSRDFYAHIGPDVSKFCYANIVDYDLGKSYLTKYYGNHVNRLIEIKRKYDPTDLFHWKQSIPLRK